MIHDGLGCTFRERPTSDYSGSQDFGFKRFSETRNETDARHLLSVDVVVTPDHPGAYRNQESQLI